ncbi:hypothetical protein TrCOL_g9297 [Triparma columacea]|uniref:Tyrosine-protein kinase ephrin type A/B receptor-like domain-containing protein n=1 Tax=Triparma columacea TaxID=722753 RepID=A0A9W7GHS6_9STRA|nr:hypothetical protein TrCOL_g9297 [Triparma columacea]
METEAAENCVFCPSGKINPSTTGASSVSVCSIDCEAGEGEAIGSLECANCVAGKYGPAAGLGCFDCGRGKFISTEGATSETQCSLCPIGKSSPAIGLPSSCESCPSGGYAPGEGYAMCAICPQNTVSDVTSTSCITQPGYYADLDGEIFQSPDGPFVDENLDRFSEVAQWQLFFTLFAALTMKVNMDDENLQNRRYFDLILSAIQFVPVLIVTVTNFISARNAIEAAKSLLGRSSNDDSGGGLEMGEISLNPVPGAANAVSTREGRSLSKQEVELGGEAVSKHEKMVEQEEK